MHRSQASPSDLEDRLQRTIEENRRLKAELREKEEKLTRVRTQFRRLTADIKSPLDVSALAEARSFTSPSSSFVRSGPSLPSVRPQQRRTSDSAKLATPSSASKAVAPPPPSSTFATSAAATASEAALREARREIAHLSAVVQQLQSQRPTGAAAGGSSSGGHPLPPVAAAPATGGGGGGGSGDAAALQQQHQHQLEQQHREHQRQLQEQQHRQHELERQFRSAIDSVTRERDGLQVQVRLFEEERRAAAAAPQPDPLSLLKLQAEVRDRSAQVTLLSSRLHGAESQVETLKAECTRLVEELKAAHEAHAALARRGFQLDHEKGALAARCVRVEELEQLVQRRSEEVVRLEGELLRMTDSLRACSADTERAVRAELGARVADLEAMRDEADMQRREKERALLQCQADLAEVRRRVTGLTADLDSYRVELSKSEREKQEMATRAAFAGHSLSEFTDEEVHRALAVAAMRKHGEGPAAAAAAAEGDSIHNVKNRSGDDGAAADGALDLYEALHWDETWERAQMREALASAALDAELADTRCRQMSEQVEHGRTMLRNISEERDTLLEENVELRRRIAFVQTTFAKEQLQAYRTGAAAAEGGGEGSISLCVRGLRCVAPAMCAALGIASLAEPVSVFVTLDGLEEYETMVSPALHALDEDEPLDLRFLYDGLARDEATLATVQRTQFVFQLHSAATAPAEEGGAEGSFVVAMAELSGAALLAARGAAVLESLTLIDGRGTVVGTLVVEVRCTQLVLPVLLGQPLAAAAVLTAAETRAALIALRSVQFLRVQVFAAHGLPQSTAAPEGIAAGGADATAAAAQISAPQPYVFYTARFVDEAAGDARAAGALRCIADSVVHPSSRAFTTDPVFDAAPVDHRVVVDRELLHFIAHGTIVFVLFDARAEDVRANLGTIEVPLHPLLASPQALIRGTEPLHPQGSLSFGISWVCGP